MKEHKVLEKLENISQDNNIAIEIHNGIGTNPSNLDADSAAEHCLEFHPDTIMGLGGGSSLDVAKIVAMLATNGGKSWDYISKWEIRKNNKDPTANIGPTTSGTGLKLPHMQ